jgi:hypothetical protein
MTLNDLKSDPSYDPLIGEVILKINVVQAENIKAKVFYIIMIFYHV